MSIHTDRIDEYLERYAASLTEFDAESAADLWSTPGMVADDHVSGVLESRDAMIAGLKQSYPLYRELGLASVGHELLDTSALTDRLVLVRVRWLFRDAQGELLTDSTSYYLLRDEDAGLRACVCIETDAAEKLRALASERGVDLHAPS
ncbi:hypothetical protein [Microbacterium sp. MYb66]|jgi:hypothetical protein|uniref:hypothetical protein n=1 Tax=Microbacterium sp. MYb66 TaxID=1848692 RepID=UPI000CFF010E|nr:hypothetical protein [Microbacterium sp. MYb66]PRA82294.1 hypothetical protein CQ045_06355 [Microbacterium sp. MYb66]